MLLIYSFGNEKFLKKLNPNKIHISFSDGRFQLLAPTHIVIQK